MKLGIFICDRYSDCAGGKCFRAVRERAGAFSQYEQGEDLEVVGFVTCGGCPGGNIEYAPEEMINNGAEAIHLATGFVVGYAPCQHIDYFKEFVEKRYQVPVVVGTHPIPEKYVKIHCQLASWSDLTEQPSLMATQDVREAYD